MRRQLAPEQNPAFTARRGTLFHYFMTYLFLSSVLLTTAGLCLHTVLKADRLDDAVSVYLKQIVLLDQTLRADAAAAVSSELQPAALSFQTGPNQQVRWSIDNNVLSRKVFVDNALEASGQFVFRRGTSFAFSQETTVLRLTLTEPPFVAKQITDGEPVISPQTKTVEFVVTVLPVIREAAESETVTSETVTSEPVTPEPAATEADAS